MDSVNETPDEPNTRWSDEPEPNGRNGTQTGTERNGTEQEQEPP